MTLNSDRYHPLYRLHIYKLISDNESVKNVNVAKFKFHSMLCNTNRIKYVI